MAHLEDRIMRIVQELSSARSFVPIGAWAPVVAVGLAIAMSSSAQNQTVSDPVYVVTYLDVGANSLGQGVDLLKQYRESSRHEAENVEFTVLQETDRPNRFAIVEGWKDQSAFDAHQKAVSTAEFEEALKAIRNSPQSARAARLCDGFGAGRVAQRCALDGGAYRLPADVRQSRSAGGQAARRGEREGGRRIALRRLPGARPACEPLF